MKKCFISLVQGIDQFWCLYLSVADQVVSTSGVTQNYFLLLDQHISNHFPNSHDVKIIFLLKQFVQRIGGKITAVEYILLKKYGWKQPVLMNRYNIPKIILCIVLMVDFHIIFLVNFMSQKYALLSKFLMVLTFVWT